ncbi:hypothetical protein CsatB_027136 [Cannabis sativa]
MKICNFLLLTFMFHFITDAIGIKKIISATYVSFYNRRYKFLVSVLKWHKQFCVISKSTQKIKKNSVYIVTVFK